jgi:hypothetical protein
VWDGISFFRGAFELIDDCFDLRIGVLLEFIGILRPAATLSKKQPSL